MPLWGIGEYRSSNLSSLRTFDEDGNSDPFNGIQICYHEPVVVGAPRPHLNLFFHQEFPMWLENRDLDLERPRQEHMTTSDNFTTTNTSGPANATHAFSVDPMGFGITLESDHSAGDLFNHAVARGYDSNRNTSAKRLTGGSRGTGYHYEYQYIDSNGNHRRRFEHLVATKTNLTTNLATGVSRVDWVRSDETT